MTDKPPWIARNERERQAMHAWVNERLDEAHESALGEDREKYDKWRREEGREYEWVEKPNGVAVLASHPDEGLFEAYRALEGDIEPARALIRQRWPLLVDLGLVQLPPLKRGKKRVSHFKRTWRTDNAHRVEPDDALLRKAFRQCQIANAVADVERIRRIWRDHYSGRKKRNSKDGPTAIEISAQRHGVTVSAVIERLKRISPSK